MDWRFSAHGPADADDTFKRAIRDSWGWTEPMLWVTVRQSAGGLGKAPKWWAGYTHEVWGLELPPDWQSELPTLTLFDPTRAVLAVVAAFRVRVTHNASGLFLERITYPDGTLTLGLRGLVDTSRPAEISAAFAPLRSAG